MDNHDLPTKSSDLVGKRVRITNEHSLSFMETGRIREIDDTPGGPPLYVVEFPDGWETPYSLDEFDVIEE